MPGLPHDAVVLARRSVLRPSPLTQYCEGCEVTIHGRECPECGRPAEMALTGQIVVRFSTGDGRRWVVWAVRDDDRRWVPERVVPAWRASVVTS